MTALHEWLRKPCYNPVDLISMVHHVGVISMTSNLNLSSKQLWFTECDKNNQVAFSMAVQQKLHDEKTKYQRIQIYQTETFGKLMVIDGCVMLTQRDNFIYHEMLTHPGLFIHPNPQNVVIIGGGDCGSLQQVLRHPVEQVVQIEIDRRVTELSEQYFAELCINNSDPRAQLLFDDGIAYIKQSASDSLDLIIIDSTDPVGPAENLFKSAFYVDCCRVLRTGGLLVQQSESPLFHTKLLNDMRQQMLTANFSQLKTCFFPQPTYPSGWWSCTLASKNGDLSQFRKQDILDKTFATKYYNADIHHSSFAVPAFLQINS